MDARIFTIVLTLVVGLIEAKTVYTSSGIVQGFEESNVYSFLGIPFAEPPTGNRRFVQPVWKRRMLGIYNATYFRPKCPQQIDDNASARPDDEFSEDCLFLNIYAPLTASKMSPKSVMVWVHGGSFIMGAGQDYPGTILADHHDVVVVTINYRLGVLGFISTGDKHLVGNYGLWDQTMALEWIKVNIGEFGGDSSSVTIFGESAGSASVTQLALSPYTQGLFHRVVAESGTASAEWSNHLQPLIPAQKLGRLLYCPVDKNEQLVECLRQKPVNEIIMAQRYMRNDNGFLPRYGTEFLPHSPLELMTTQKNSTLAKRLAGLDFIIGQNSDEGAMFFRSSLAAVLEPGETVDDTTGMTQRIFDSALIQAAMLVTNDNTVMAEKVLAPLKFMYRVWKHKTDGITLAKDYVRLVSDVFFTGSIVEFARTHAFLRRYWSENNRPSVTYSYLFDHRGSWMSKEAWRTGADHADEIYFVFGFPHLGIEAAATEEEKTLSTTVMKYWTNFAKTGNPNSLQPGASEVRWPTFEPETEKYITLNTNMAEPNSIGQRVFNERVGFWSEYLPSQLAIFSKEPVPGRCT